MDRRYHREENRQSTGTFVSFLTVLAIASATEVFAAPLKDCVAMAEGVPTTVHEGRYNILCVAPPPGPLTLNCAIRGTRGRSTLQVFPHAIAGAAEATVEMPDDGPLPTIAGRAGDTARVFFSYAGPFDPIRDGYDLTCRW
ncbi:MAG: hypothetical protein P1U88_12900 [Thalassobaculaceae bacterium]|nr:hypothetical protein [Thalassobaculaceae bacterium]